MKAALTTKPVPSPCANEAARRTYQGACTREARALLARTEPEPAQGLTVTATREPLRMMARFAPEPARALAEAIIAFLESR
jgi:hypothetical protein